MRNVIQLAAIGLMALSIAGVQLNVNEQAADAPGANEGAAKAERSIPFNGTLKAMDREAGTILVGNRTFKLTRETRYLQGSLEEAKVGEKVGGSYRKSEDGTLTVSSIRIGPKAGKGSEASSTTE